LIVPGRRTLLFAGILALLLIAAVAEHLVVLAAILGDLLLIGYCMLEGRSLAGANVDVRAEAWPSLQVGREAILRYRISNRSNRAIIVRIRQPWPTSVEAKENEAETTVASGEIVDVGLAITPRSRGSIDVDPTEIDVRYRSDWARHRRRSRVPALRVLPSLRGLSEYDALRRDRASMLGGLHRQRMVGAGREFEQLRDYMADDDFRDINWRATARRRKPITNTYQAERSRDLILCLDCGRMMGNPIGGATALDHAIDAAIMLAHVANRQGDRVGLALFRDVVERFVKPAAGLLAVNRIINELVDAKAQSVFPSYAAMLSALRAHQNRRSLVLLFTDLNDPQLAANLAEALPSASRRHVVVVISLRDPMLDRVASGPAVDRQGVYQVVAARQLAIERATRSRELERIGAHVLEADADSLTVKLLNMYLSIKARQLL
jgi:uncharacterized protein (DUF58 family)